MECQLDSVPASGNSDAVPRRCKLIESPRPETRPGTSRSVVRRTLVGGRAARLGFENFDFFNEFVDLLLLLVDHVVELLKQSILSGDFDFQFGEAFFEGIDDHGSSVTKTSSVINVHV